MKQPVVLSFAILMVLVGPLRAQPAPGEPPAPEAPPPPPPPPPPQPLPPQPDPELLKRYDELSDHVKQLEARLRELQDREPPVEPVAAESTHDLLPPRSAESLGTDLTAPLAGYARKTVFLRDRDDNFVLVPKGRLNVDYYQFLHRPSLPAGVVENSAADPTQAARDNAFIRRARIGLAGTIARHVDFRIEGELANVPSAGQYATLTDASIQFNWSRYALLEVGQFYAPFTLENPTSENYTDFMEKSASVRWAVPSSRETGAMVLGELPSEIGRYWVGVFDGDGQNFKNQDNRGAVIGRAHITPLAASAGQDDWKKNLWIGGSVWAQRTQNLGGFVAPSTSGATQNDLTSLTTQGGISIFNSSFGNGVDANGNAIRSHVTPDGSTIKYAGELNVPLPHRFGVRGELIHQSLWLREYNDVNPGTGNLTRSRGADGLLAGVGGYAEIYAWFGGDADTDVPGLYKNPHWSGYQAPKPAQWSLMLAAKYEHIGFTLSGLSTGTDANGNPVPDPAAGGYKLDVFELGATLWLTRHSRVMLNYAANYLGGNLDTASKLETKNIWFHFSDHELAARFAVQL